MVKVVAEAQWEEGRLEGEEEEEEEGMEEEQDMWQVDMEEEEDTGEAVEDTPGRCCNNKTLIFDH